MEFPKILECQKKILKTICPWENTVEIDSGNLGKSYKVNGNLENVNRLQKVIYNAISGSRNHENNGMLKEKLGEIFENLEKRYDHRKTQSRSTLAILENLGNIETRKTLTKRVPKTNFPTTETPEILKIMKTGAPQTLAKQSKKQCITEILKNLEIRGQPTNRRASRKGKLWNPADPGTVRPPERL